MDFSDNIYFMKLYQIYEDLKNQKLKYYHATRYRYKVGDRIKTHDMPKVCIATSPILHDTIDLMFTIPGRNYSESVEILNNMWKKVKTLFRNDDFSNGGPAMKYYDWLIKQYKLKAEKKPIYIYEVEPIGKIKYSQFGHLEATDAEVMKIIGNARGIYNNYYKKGQSIGRVKNTNTNFGQYIKAKKAFKFR